MLTFTPRDVRELGYGQSVEVEPSTGALRVAIPVMTTPGRGSLTPQLRLVYGAGPGQAAFSWGWGLEGVPSVGIDLSPGCPRYGAQDGYTAGGVRLVADLAQSGPRQWSDGDFDVLVLRPIHGPVSTRWERWRHRETGRVHFVSRSEDGVVTWFGRSAGSTTRICDPADELRTASWLPERSVDGEGNVMEWEWWAETGDGVDPTRACEQGREQRAQRYLRAIRYANTLPADASGELPAEGRFALVLALDYGDRARRDPHSSYVLGFEVRTYRLCRGFRMLHVFPELGSTAAVVHETTLEYDEEATGAALVAVRHTGHASDGSSRALPPLRMTYARPRLGDAFSPLPASAHEHTPVGLAGARTGLVDLYGEGVPGLLLESDGGWYYKHNLGGGHFAAMTEVLERPAVRPGTYLIGDANGDGDTDVALSDTRYAGEFALDRERQRWTGFVPSTAIPHAEAMGARVSRVDLNGDGWPDLVVDQHDHLVWYASNGEDEFEPPVEVTKPHDVRGVPMVGSSVALGLSFARLSGGSQLDLVRVTEGRIEYWPHKGHGEFARAVVMDAPPSLASEGGFDPRRVRFVDLTGSGTDDLVYLDRGRVRVFWNARGNGWVVGPQIDGLPTFDRVAVVDVAAVFGDGRPCLVWSPVVPSAASSLEALPLLVGEPPGRIVRVDDGLGTTTHVHYATSAEDYLDAQARGEPWRTRAPSHPVVVRRLTVDDALQPNPSVTRYRYRDAQHSREDRRFVCFGLVEILEQQSEEAFAPERRTRLWFHPGQEVIASLREAYRDAALGLPLSRSPVDSVSADVDDLGDGLRALSGVEIRRETYAGDSAVPLEVVERAYRARVRQAGRGRGPRRIPAVTVVLPDEERTHVLEGASDDARSSQSLVLEVDAYDRVTASLSVALPRMATAVSDAPAQGSARLELERTRWAHVDTVSRWQIGAIVETQRFELTGVASTGTRYYDHRHFLGADVAAALATPIAHHAEAPAGSVRARRLGWTRTLYWDQGSTVALPLGSVSAPLRIHHEEVACMAVDRGAALGQTAMSLDYRVSDEHWWAHSPTRIPGSAFGLVSRLERSDGATTRFEYDDANLVLVRATDPVGNVTDGVIDHRRLALRQIRDANAYVQEVQYDGLGVIVASCERGTVLSDTMGMMPWGAPALVPLGAVDVDVLLSDPVTTVGQRGRVLAYRLRSDHQPTMQVAALRSHRDGELTADQVELAIEWYDAWRRPLARKVKATGGPAIQRTASSELLVDASGAPVLAASATRWRTDGAITYDGRQLPGRQFQPYYSATHALETDVRLEPSSLTLFDARGQQAQQVSPDGTVSTWARTAWSITFGDGVDNVEGSTWATARQGLPASHVERIALERSRAHAGTPTTDYLDPLGRTVVRLQRGNTSAPDLRTTYHYRDDAQPSGMVDPRGLSDHVTERDMVGRPLSQRTNDAGERRSVVDAFGRVVVMTEARGFVETRRYDLADRILTVDRLSPSGDLRRVEVRTYGESEPDAAPRGLRGRLAIIQDGAGELRVDRVWPDGLPWRATRRLRADIAGEPDWSAGEALQAESFVEEAEHDPLGRPLELRPPDETVQRWRYGLGGTLAEYTVASSTGAFAERRVVSSVEHDAWNRRTHVQWGDRLALRWTYDRWNGHLIHTDVDRLNAAGAVQRSLSSVRMTYDAAGHVVQQEDAALAPSAPLPVLTGASTSAHQDFEYDAHGRLVVATGRSHGALTRTTSWTGPPMMSLSDGGLLERYRRTYRYDDVGNLLRVQHQATTTWRQDFWVSSTSNRSVPALTPTGAPVTDGAAHFDAAGNLVRVDHLRSMAWGGAGRLLRAVVIDRGGAQDDAVAFAYDAAGARVWKRSQRLVHGLVEVTESVNLGSCELKRVWRGNELRLHRWRSQLEDGAETVGELRRWTLDVAAAEVESTEDVRLTYAVRDQRQSTLLELSEVGEVLTHEAYFPYGGTAWLAGPSALDVRLKERRFTGRDRDVQTGLYDFGQRYYAPWLCRWISADPAGPIDGHNLYAYVRGDPIGRVDADGLQSADPNAPKVRYQATPEFPAGAAKTLPEGHVQWPDENGVWHSAPLAEVVERERQKGATEVVVTTPARPDPAEVAEFESMLDSLSEYTGATRLENGDSSGATTRTSHTTPDATEVDTREPPPTPILTLLAGESPEAFAARVVRQSQDPKYVPPDPDSGLLKLAGYSMAMGAVLGLSALASLGAAAALGATAETWTGVAVIGAVGNATADVGQRALDDAALRGKVSDADEYVEGAVDSAFLGAILALPARWIGLQMTPNDKNVAAAAADQASPPTGLVDDAASSATHVPAVDPSPPLDARASAAVATAGEEGATQLKPYLRAADAARDQSRLRHPGLAEDAVASGGSGHTPMSPEEVLDIAQSLKQTEGATGGGALPGGAGAAQSALEPEVIDFVGRFEQRYPGRPYLSGHSRRASDGRLLEIDFETDNVIVEIKAGRGGGLTRQLQDRMDPTVNPAAKPLIGISYDRDGISPHVAKGIAKLRQLAASSSQIDLILDILMP